MEKSVEMQFSEEVLQKAALLFGLKETGLKELGKFENYVYEGEKEGNHYILRLTHSSHRNEAEVIGELHWVKFLADEGVNVAKPYPSLEGNLVEVVPVGEDYFIVCLFEKAQGNLVDVNNPQEWNEDLFTTWGRTIGKMHRVISGYEAPDEKYRRPQWDEEDLLNLEKYLSTEDDATVIEKGRKLISYIKTLPKEDNSFGLIHTDIHFRNFFVHKGEITVFDFDDAAYQWFISDIAIALYYSVWWCTMGQTPEEKIKFAQTYLHAFLKGYREEYQLEEYWLQQLPYFLKLRDVVLYAVLNKKFDMENLNERQIALLNEIKERIEKEKPIVEVNPLEFR